GKHGPKPVSTASMRTAWRRPRCSRRLPSSSRPTARTPPRAMPRTCRPGFATASFPSTCGGSRHPVPAILHAEIRALARRLRGGFAGASAPRARRLYVPGMRAALLPDRGVVKVVGDDIRRFLNGLLTADLTQVAPGKARYAALLTPQGKIIVDCIVAEMPESE